ncbi:MULTISPECIES: sensor histidine kinase [Mycolicibacterium]|jgi:signal transduction histidine kinase|nr:GAF domain-containing protein [Mycolicibacterium chlorophenolicum]
MHEQLDELLAARDQMEQVLGLIVEIGSDLDLDATLQRIVHAAMGLTGARYGALGVRAADGTLASFHHLGMDADTVHGIGHLPVGKGVLGLLLDRTSTVRLDDLTQHPAAVGFPEHHPPMRGFLGVPIIIRKTVYGSLYLADDQPGHGFSASDEIAARALAAAAGVAIDNARLFDRVTRAVQWVTASREISTAVLSGEAPQAESLQVIAERARDLTDAEQAIVLVPTDPDLPATDIDTLVVLTAVGVHAGEVIGQQVPVQGSTSGEVFRTGKPVITESFRYPIAAFTDVGQRSAVLMPLRAGDTVLGVIAVARDPHQPRFGPSYLDLVSDFAGHAAIALRLAAAHARERELSVAVDRERIAHDLHDHVIQKLFAAGMDLQGSIARARSPELVERLTRTVDDLQATIDAIRTSNFGLQHPRGQVADFRQRIQRLIAELTENRPIATTLQMRGSITGVGVELADHADAVITEAISNTVRHSGASRLTIEITTGDELAIDLIDNGCGIPTDNQRRSGLSNMERRAERLGGTCQITTPSEGGTHVRWTAPIIES